MASVLLPAAPSGPVGTLDDTTSGGEPGGPGTAVAGTRPLGVATIAAGGDPGGPVTIITGAEPGVATATGMGGDPGGPATAATGGEPGGPGTTITGDALRVVATPGVDEGPCELLGPPATGRNVVILGPGYIRLSADTDVHVQRTPIVLIRLHTCCQPHKCAFHFCSMQ